MPDISRLVIEVDSKGVVTATGNLENFAKTSDKAGKSTSDLSGKLRSTGKDTDNLADKFGAFQLIVNKLPGPLQSIASGLMGMVNPATAAAGALLEIGEAAVQFARESIQAFADFEMIKVNLETVMGNVELATLTFNELRDMAARTPFGVEGLASAAVQLKQTGTEAKDLITVLTMLGDVAGGSSEKFDRIVANFAQIQSIGQATSMDLRQFASAGLPIYDMLKKLGVEGTATADDVRKAFEMMAGEGGAFFGAMARGAETLQGKMANLEDSWKTFQATFAETTGLAELWKGTIDGVTEAVDTLTQTMNGSIDIFGNLNRDGYRTQESYDLATVERKIAEAERKLSNFESQPAVLRPINDIFINSLTAQLEVLNEQRDTLQSIIDLQNARNNEEAERLAEIEAWRTAELQRQLDLIQLQEAKEIEIREAFEKTAEGEAQALEAKIAYWEELRDTQFEYATGEYDIIEGQQVPIYDTKGLSDEFKRMIDIIIDGLKKTDSSVDKTIVQFDDWIDVLSQATGYSQELVRSLTGLGTVRQYAVEGVEAIRDRYFAAIPGGGSVYEALGLNKSDILNEAASKMEALIKKMTDARLTDTEPWSAEKDASYQYALQFYIQLKSDAQNATYEEALRELEVRKELLGLSQEELEIRELAAETGSRAAAEQFVYAQRRIEEAQSLRELSDATWRQQEYYRSDASGRSRMQVEDALINAGIGNPSEQDITDWQKVFDYNYELQYTQEINDSYKTAYQQSVDRLMVEQGISEEMAKQVISAKSYSDALHTVLDAIIDISSTNFLSFTQELGQAFRDGSISTDEFTESIWNMLKSLIDAMPQLLLNVGLQLLSGETWPLGLALIGASGLMSFVSGLTDSAEQDGRKDEEERLRRIQQQITDLIDSQRKQEEYYLTQKRKIDSTAMSVNDAIITPSGIINTHPEDYIIATKHPETLMSGGGSNVIVKIINNAGVHISEQETTGADGTKEILMEIDKYVKSGIAGGRYDGAFNAMNARNYGKRINA